MKTYTYTLACVVILALSGCFTSNKYLVESDYSYQGNFKKYNSFFFATDPKAPADSSVNYSLLEDAIRYQLQIHGYKFSDRKPSLLVFYKVFYDDVKYNGYYQPELNMWIKNESDEEKYEPVKYNLNKGTLLIQLVDTKKNQSIWQGYASGIFTQQNLNSERYLKHAVRSILDKYRMFVEGYLVDEKGEYN